MRTASPPTAVNPVTGWRAVAASVAFLALMLEPLQAQQRPLQPQNVFAGSSVFGGLGCSECHAIEGHGGGVGPDLGTTVAGQSFEGFVSALWNHLPNMVEGMREHGIERQRMSPWGAGDLIAFLFWVGYFNASGSVNEGRGLFIEKQCAACHQVGGEGGVYAPSLDFLSRYGSPIQIAAAMWNHGPAMAEAMQSRGLERPTFSGQELASLIAYLESAAPGLADEPLYVLPGRSDIGRQYFEQKGCAACHGAGGRGGGVGPALVGQLARRSLIDFAAAMWNKEPAMIRAAQARGISIPRLHADEMADLIAYLYSVDYFGGSGSSARGEGLLSGKGCLDCHSLRGRGGSTAGDLGQRGNLESLGAVTAALWNHILVPDLATVNWRSINAREMADLTAFLQASGR